MVGGVKYGALAQGNKASYVVLPLAGTYVNVCGGFKLLVYAV